MTMDQHGVTVPGVPAGFELVEFRVPKPSDWVLDVDGNAVNGLYTGLVYPILRPVGRPDFCRLLVREYAIPSPVGFSTMWATPGVAATIPGALELDTPPRTVCWNKPVGASNANESRGLQPDICNHGGGTETPRSMEV